MDNLPQKIKEAADYIRSRSETSPEVGIILGTGLGSTAKAIDVETTIEYGDIPHFPISTVESHSGRLLMGSLSGKKVMAMQGRFHYYEGYTLQQVTFPVRVMKEMGCKAMIVSNACGGMNPLFKPGDIMVIVDHINLQGDNPLIGKNWEELGPRFPDMYQTYDREFIELASEVALEEKIQLHRGVYVAVSGPNLETGAEYRFLRIIGADVVGMSTVPEVIVARHQGTRVLGFSCITDMGFPEAMKPCSLEDVIATAAVAEPKLERMIIKTLGRMKL